MNKAISPEIREVMEAVHYRPAVSIILPFEAKMGLKNEVLNSLKSAADKVELELLESYPQELSNIVMLKLRAIITDLDVDTNKKSVAIYVSPVFEKVLFLDVTIEEKIIVDESFEIRDLVYSKKQLHKYLVLLWSAKESRMYLGNTNSFVRIVSTTPESVFAYVNDEPEKVANFTDSSSRKEIVMNKFLHHIDAELDTVLNNHPLPIFVLGTDRIMGHFKYITRHAKSVIEYIHGNYEEATLPELKAILKPSIASWDKMKQRVLLNQLEGAASNRKLAIGIRDVWRETMNQRGRLLLVEKNYMFPAQRGGREDEIYTAGDAGTKVLYIKDAVDVIIEKVLENGGDVEFVDPGVLKDYHQIALLQYY